MKDEFWSYLQRLVDESEIIIDRPKGSAHHRFPGSIYPVDYGNLQGTTSTDGAEVDIWVGTLEVKEVVGTLCTVDLLKRDTELKILYGCSREEIKAIVEFINQQQMRAIAITKEENRSKFMSWIPEEYQDLIKDETKAFGFLTTLMKDGSPQLTPVWFKADEKFIYINSAVGRVKDRNMRRDPRVAFVIFDPKNPYRYLQVRGKVVDITTEGARDHIDALAKKYTGAQKYSSSNPDEVRVMYTILPEKVQRQ